MSDKKKELNSNFTVLNGTFDTSSGFVMALQNQSNSSNVKVEVASVESEYNFVCQSERMFTLIVNGDKREQTIAVYDSNYDGLICPNLVATDIETKFATGGLLSGKYPLICGGAAISALNRQKECTILGFATSDEEPVSMQTSRERAASIVIGHNDDTLFVAGGER